MNFSHADVESAIRSVIADIGHSPSRALQQEYEAGLHPTLLSYDKVEPSVVEVPVLTRYLVGARSYLNPYANYHNIFGAHRSVYMVQLLARSLRVLRSKKAIGLDARLARLIDAKKRDAFDAVAFEIFTAARYAESPHTLAVEFLAEKPPALTPDLRVELTRIETFVECKKIDRTQNATLLVRNAARDLLNPVLSAFKEGGTSVLLRVTFHIDPKLIQGRQLLEACRASLTGGVPIIEQGFTIQAQRLSAYSENDPILFPSPLFNSQRYGYKVRSEWVGIVHQGEVQFSRRTDLPPSLQGGTSSWLCGLGWDAGAIWKVSSPDVLAKYRRFTFERVFHGLDQLQGRGLNCALHVWLESDYYTGGRSEVFHDLFRRIKEAEKHHFGWLVLNETLFDVSPKGRFDFIEHAHIIQGPMAVTRLTVVSNVFISDGETHLGEFGEGTELPDIDEPSDETTTQ